MVLLLVPFHSFVTFTPTGDSFVKYRMDAPVMDIILRFLSIWIMPVLFVAAGVSSFHSLQSRTPGQYASERREKLLIPLLAGFILVCLPLTWLQSIFKGSFEGGFLQFIPAFFANGLFPRGYLNWGHLWFLDYLFVFSLILLPVFVRLKREPFRSKLVKVSSILERGVWIYLAAVPLMLAHTVLRPFSPGPQNFINDWANVASSLVLFLYGFIFAANPAILENIRHIGRFSLIAGLVLFAANLLIWRPEFHLPLGSIRPAYFALMVFAWTFAVLGYAAKYLNGKNRFYAYLNRSSFPFYIFHYVPITILAFFIANSDVNVWLRALALIAVAYPVTFIIYEIVRRISFVRYLFGTNS